MALSKFGGKTEKCGRRYFYFADFANLSGDAGSDELQRDLGRQRGQIGSVQAGMVRTCEEGWRRLGRHDHNGAYTVRKVCLGWDYQVLETPRDSETHQTLSSLNGHSNQALLVHSLSPGQRESREIREARVALQHLQAR